MVQGKYLYPEFRESIGGRSVKASPLPLAFSHVELAY
jgi:hypothetical protein